MNPQEHSGFLPSEEPSANAKKPSLTSRFTAEISDRICRTLFPIPAPQAHSAADYEFVDLAKEAKEPGGVEKVIKGIERIYNQRLCEVGILIDCMRQGGTPEEILGRRERITNAFRTGRYLFPFNGEDDSVVAGLRRDLRHNPNYAAFGLRDREDGRLVTYSTAYYPSSEHGEWSATQEVSLAEREELEEEMMSEKAIRQFGPPVPLPRRLTRYTWHICKHLARILFMSGYQREQRGAWIGEWSERVIGYDTIGVESHDGNGEPQRRKGLGIETMYRTCEALLERLPSRPTWNDWIILSYRFNNIIPLKYHPDPEQRTPMARWNDVQELSSNPRSGSLFTGAEFSTLGTHREKRHLIRDDPEPGPHRLPEGVSGERRALGGGPRPLAFDVVWLDEQQKIRAAMMKWGISRLQIVGK